MTNEYIYRYRAVAFLDVLGFKNKLYEFETEAKANRVEQEDDEEINTIGKYTSIKANDFINTFLGAIEKLDNQKFSYYLFSDNICITSISHTDPSDLEDMLMIISELYFDFAQKGYFLRGGIDYGLFIDENKIAVGIPLATAYELESHFANYPRIVLSDNLVNQFQEFNNSGEKIFNNPFADLMVSKSCEISFLNIFLHVFQSDYREQKEEFFSHFKEAIAGNLEENKMKERIFEKYKWLADEFNSFIEMFTSNLAFLDENFNPDEEAGFIEFVQQQKINYAE